MITRANELCLVAAEIIVNKLLDGFGEHNQECEETKAKGEEIQDVHMPMD